MSNLRIKNLTRKYGNIKALDDFSLEIKSGEFMVLLGPSGCGKTTAIRCIAGLINPSSGQIYIDDELVNDIPPKNRDIAMVFQNYALYPHMSVYDNIAFPLKMRKKSKSYTEEKINEVANLLGMMDLLNRKPKELSGGQMQRVALGRALVREPKVFLMDEPLSNLDAQLRMYMRTEIKKLQKKVGITTLYITHDQIEAMSMADKIAVMNSGLLQQVGRPQEIYNQPSNTFVAGFVGSPSMNFLECNLIKHTTTIHLESNGISFKLPDIETGSSSSKSLPKKLTIGIRPKDINILDDGKEDLVDIKMKGEITFTEMLGDDSIIEVKMGSSLIKVANTNLTLDLSIGSIIVLGMFHDKIHFFDTN
ncbi:MAG TPA: ABC transporter ATP-binding protein, partial [Nitrososphaeraceae archaeon]|nr:ABC transporter ATP-binding protein [Nitrososphaeraceae archaeon]